MTDKVVRIHPHRSVEALLEVAKGWGMSDVLLIGYDGDRQVVMGGTFDSLAENILLLKRAENTMLLEVDTEYDR